MTRLLTLSFALLLVIGCGDDATPPGDAGPRDAPTADVPGMDAPGMDAPGMDGGDCPAEVTVDNDIEADTTWACPVYVLTRKIFVTMDSTLTINAGVTVLGEAGGSEETALIVTRGSQLVAAGTATSPVVFTSGNPEGARTTGDWAGVALLGSARVNDGECVDDAMPATEACDAPGYFEGALEGIEVADVRGAYGGTDDASSCGSLEYVRIEFAGAELSPDNELNGLTVAGCGSGTNLSFIQVHRGSDDGVEFFGGTANADHLVLSGIDDDSLDCDLGWTGSVQFAVIHQYAGLGDHGIECDNLGGAEASTPRTNPTLFNFTMIGTADTRGMLLREGFRGTLRNFIIQGFGTEAVDLAAVTNDLSTEWPGELSIENSFFFMNGAYAAETGMDDDDGGFVEQTAIEDAARNNTTGTDPMIGDTSITAPDYVATNTALNDQATPTFGDVTATYAGAFPVGGANWAQGWTAYPEN